MCHTVGQCHCALFSEVLILGDEAFTRKPIDQQNGKRGTVDACEVPARGQYTVMKLSRLTPKKRFSDKLHNLATMDSTRLIPLVTNPWKSSTE